MKLEFEMTDMGHLHYFLGIEVHQRDDGISISQKKYASDILNRFRMDNAIPKSTLMEYGLKLSKDSQEASVDSRLYRSLIGSLMYLTATRPDIMYAINVLSRFMEEPKQSHWDAGMRVLKFIKGTPDHGTLYRKVESPKLMAYCDSDFEGSVDDSKSTSGYVFMMNSGAISWLFKKQRVVALSSAEAEYISVSLVGCQAIWMRGILEELKHPQSEPTLIQCDNKSAIALTKNPVYRGKSKHIRIKYHFIRDLVKCGDVVVAFCRTSDQVADILTKALKPADFLKMKGRLGVMQV